VSDWIRATSRVGEIINTPRPGTAIGRRLAADGGTRIGVLELDALPAGLYDDVAIAAPAAELIDASALFAAERCNVDDAERKLIARADALALAALGEVDLAAIGDAGALAGLVERHARLGGAEEAFIAVAPDLDSDRRLVRMSKPVPLAGRFALRASIAYKGSWVRRTRTFARDPAGQRAAARGAAWLDQVGQSLDGRGSLATQLAARLQQDLPGAELKAFMAETCIGSYPLEAVTASNSPAQHEPGIGTFVVLSVELRIDGVPWLGAVPALVGVAS
jgi:hypothetical protein